MNINSHNQKQLILIRSRYLVTKNLIHTELADNPVHKAEVYKELLIFGYSAIYVINNSNSHDKLVSGDQVKLLLLRFDEIEQKITQVF